MKKAEGVIVGGLFFFFKHVWLLHRNSSCLYSAVNTLVNEVPMLRAQWTYFMVWAPDATNSRFLVSLIILSSPTSLSFK